MQAAASPTRASPTSTFPSAEAEAARYALLRRLAPSMRHHLVVNLQPIGMIYEVMDRRLRAPVPDIPHVQESASKINGFAKAALNSCLDVVSWLAPDDTVTITVQEAVRECTGLLATSLSFRGYNLRNQVNDSPRVVRRSSIRSLLSASLVHCTDQVAAPADLVLRCETEAGGVCLAIEARPTGGENRGYSGEPNYRKLAWSDLEALAVADDVQIRQEGGRIELRLPWVEET